MHTYLEVNSFFCLKLIGKTLRIFATRLGISLLRLRNEIGIYKTLLNNKNLIRSF